MKFYEYSNGRYHVSEDIFTSEKNTTVSGIYGRYPVYPNYWIESSVDKTISQGLVIQLTTCVNIKNSMVYVSNRYNFITFNSDKLIELIKDFERYIKECQKTIIPKNLI